LGNGLPTRICTTDDTKNIYRGWKETTVEYLIVAFRQWIF
jgi:hypothetical protein